MRHHSLRHADRHSAHGPFGVDKTQRSAAVLTDDTDEIDETDEDDTD